MSASTHAMSPQTVEFAEEKPQPRTGELVRDVPQAIFPNKHANASELAQLNSWIVDWLADLLVADYLRTGGSPGGTNREVA